MDLKDFHLGYRSTLTKTTLGILRQDNSVNLALKKRGFGAGMWNFCGGKFDVALDTDIEACVTREMLEECGTQANQLRLVAILYFYFVDNPQEKSWNQKCYVYQIDDWSGEPKESAEMKPQWFNIEAIPYSEMWPADRQWIPHVLAGHTVTGYFLFDSKPSVIETQIVVDQIIDE